MQGTNVDAAILQGMAVGLGISTQTLDAGMETEDDGQLSARSRSPDPAGSLGPLPGRLSTGGSRSSPYPKAGHSPEELLQGSCLRKWTL